MTQFLDFDHILTTKPHHIRAVFIADLHLSCHSSLLNTAFLALLADLSVLPNLSALYILGDFLDAWIDEAITPTHYLSPIINALHALPCQVYVMHGNRDFMIDKHFCQKFGGQLLQEPFYLNLSNHKIRLEHGDRLCLDDKNYQRYRHIIRNPISLFLLHHLPLSCKKRLAQKIKSTALANKNHKTQQMMDVNANALQNALHDCDILLHGHTHRPNIHKVDMHPNHPPKLQMVLGNWQIYQKKVNAIIGVWNDDTTEELGLYCFNYR